MSESVENQEVTTNTVEGGEQEFSLKSFSYKLKRRPVSKGSVGSLWIATQFCFRKIDPKSPFGQKFMTLEDKLEPLLNAVNQLFVDYYCETGYTGDLIYSVFLDDFRGRSYVRGSNRDHLNANLATVVECLLHRLRYWHRRLERSGWNGKFWSEQNQFQDRLADLLTLVPDQVEETFLVRNREEEKTNASDNTNEEETGENESTGDNKGDNGENEEEEDYDRTKFRKVRKFVEPFVKEIEDVVREAVLAQRQATAENNVKQAKTSRPVPRKQSKYVKGKQRREMKKMEKDQNEEDNGDGGEWQEQNKNHPKEKKSQKNNGYKNVMKWVEKKEKGHAVKPEENNSAEEEQDTQATDTTDKVEPESGVVEEE
jgi:hypothetical protein